MTLTKCPLDGLHNFDRARFRPKAQVEVVVVGDGGVIVMVDRIPILDFDLCVHVSCKGKEGELREPQKNARR